MVFKSVVFKSVHYDVLLLSFHASDYFLMLVFFISLCSVYSMRIDFLLEKHENFLMHFSSESNEEMLC